MANGLDESLEKFRSQDNLDESKIKPHKKMAMKGIQKPKSYFHGSASLMGDCGEYK